MAAKKSGGGSRDGGGSGGRKTWDVQPDGKGRGDWEVKREGGQRASSVHERKSDAVKEATRLGHAEQDRGGKGQVRIKDERGRIQDERTYGSDPEKSKG